MMRQLSIKALGFSFALISMPALSCDWHPYAVMGLGVAQTNQTQRLMLHTTPAPGLVNQYESADISASTKMFGMGMSKVVPEANNGSDLLVGIEALYLRNDHAPGMIRPLINVGSNFDTLNFSYDMESYLVLAKATINTPNFIIYHVLPCGRANQVYL